MASRFAWNCSALGWKSKTFQWEETILGFTNQAPRGIRRGGLSHPGALKITESWLPTGLDIVEFSRKTGVPGGVCSQDGRIRELFRLSLILLLSVPLYKVNWVGHSTGEACLQQPAWVRWQCPLLRWHLYSSHSSFTLLTRQSGDSAGQVKFGQLWRWPAALAKYFFTPWSLILTVNLWGRKDHYPCFTHKKKGHKMMWPRYQEGKTWSTAT